MLVSKRSMKMPQILRLDVDDSATFPQKYFYRHKVVKCSNPHIPHQNSGMSTVDHGPKKTGH